jgi:trigger factor
MRMSKEDYLSSIEKTEEEFDADLVEQSQRSVKTSFVLDELSRTENLSVNQAELSYFVADQAQRMGVSPDYFAQQLVQNNQINVAVTEVLRGKAATIVAERVAVTDEAGNAVDVKAQIETLNADVDAMLAAQAEAQAGAEGDIAVDDLSIDVAGTIEAEDEAQAEAAADAVVEAETIVEAEAVAEEVVAEAIEEDDSVAEATDEDEA